MTEGVSAPVQDPVLDGAAFRKALGTFATGVTVVTTCRDAGIPLGVTISSFNAVSLDPPLILWSLGRSRGSLAVFEACEYYAVNVLSHEQQHLSRCFAGAVKAPFQHVAYKRGLGGVPLLEGCCGYFEVRNTIRHPAGDHILFLGAVERFRHVGSQPLVFHDGRYWSLVTARSVCEAPTV